MTAAPPVPLLYCATLLCRGQRVENTSRLLERHYDSLGERRVCVVGADDNALAQLPGRTLHLHSDDITVTAAHSGWLPSLPADTDLVIVILPKSRPQLAFWLASVAGQIQQPLEVWLVGAASGGIRGGVTTLKQFADNVSQVDSARHCKLFAATLRPAPFDADDFASHWSAQGVELVSYPGVFSHGRLDAGTELLLQTLTHQVPAGAVLDIGCGAGVISSWLAKQGARVTAVDVSAVAVASTRQSLACNGVEAAVLQSDLFAAVEGRFDALVTNPPFHDGTRHTTDISRRLISEAPAYLRPGGELWLVANQALPYADWLHAAFSTVQVARENRHFRVWHACLA